MTKNYSVQNKSKASLLSVVETLDKNFQPVMDSLLVFRTRLEALDNEQVKEDLDSLKKGADRFQKLVALCYEPVEQNKLLEDEHLREVRHDMRAAIGIVMGYAELIQESLEDLKAPQELFQMATTLHKDASNMLIIIEGFVLDKVDVSLNEGEGFEDYLSRVIKGNILIVDDNPQKRDLLTRKLKKVGHHITAVEDAFKALEFLKETIPDIILLDLFMPGMNGDEMLQKIKGDERLKEIPVLVISSSSDMDNIVTCIRLGADDYLPMPVNNTLLHARLNACLTKKLSRDREKETLAELEKARQRLRTALENIDEGFAVFDSNDVLITCNKRFSDLYAGVKALGGLGFSYEDLIKENIKLGVYQVERRHSSSSPACLNDKEMNEWMSLKIGYHQNSTRSHIDLLSSGTWIEVIENKIPGGGIVSVHKDISEVKKKEERLEYLALYDGLTGLANRKNFDEALEKLLLEAKEKSQKFGVVFFDLDGFKNVNDTLGHDFGDFVLKTVAEKLTQSVRESDLVCRFGGDEFAALITDISSQEDIIQVAERCLESIGTHVEKEGETARFGVSIGISIYPKNALEADELLKKADAAMYEAKKAGKGTYRLAG